MPYLIQKAADGSDVKQWDLHQFRTLTFGRGDKADAKIDDPNMSRRHFKVSAKEGGYVIEDLDSTNGTKVNGDRVSEVVLQPDAKIRAGNSRFVFVEGLQTVIGKVEKEGKRLSSFVRELKKKAGREARE